MEKTEKVYSVSTDRGDYQIKGYNISSNGVNFYILDKDDTALALFACSSLISVIAKSALSET